MPVTSKEIGSVEPPRTRPDLSLALGKLAVWLAVLVFGGIVWVINGGFSVIGLGVVASNFHDAGKLFWAAMNTITFSVPAPVAGLPRTQPLLPWIGVVAASLCQVVALFRQLNKLKTPLWLWLATLGLSLYDLASTFFGLGTVAWIAGAGTIVQVLLACFLTFVVEVAIGFLLRRRR